MAKDKDRARRTAPSRGGALAEPARNWFDFHPRITLAVLCFLLLVVFYHPLVFQGMTFGTPDSYAPAGFSKVGQDALDHRHIYPLWNPFIFTGMPSFGSLSFNPYIYPPDWPFALADKLVHLPPSFIVLLYTGLGAFFMGLLLLELGLPIMSSLWGAVVFAFTPNFIAMGAYGHGSKVATVAYLPLVLWLAERLFKHWRLRDLGWLALALGFQMLRAHIQIVYYTGMTLGLYYLVHAASLVRSGARATKILRDGAGLVAAYTLAAGLAAFLLLPVKDYQKYSVRGAAEGGGAKLEYATRWSFGPPEIATFFNPSSMGFGGATYVGTVKPFTDYPNYMGLLALFLAGAGFVLVRDRMSLFAGLLGLLALLISFGEYFKPLYEFLYHHLPFFNAFRVPVMILILLQFAVALLSARGLYALIGRLTVAGRETVVKRTWIAAGVAATVLLVLVMTSGSWASGYEQALRTAPQGAGLPGEALSQLVMNATAHYLDDTWKVWGVVAAGLAALALLGSGRMSRNLFWVALVGLLLFDLWRVDYRIFMPPQSEVDARLRTPLLVPIAELHQTVEDADDAIRFLQADTTKFRVLPYDDFTSNKYSGFGIASLGGYNPAKPALYDDIIQSQSIANPRFWLTSNLKYLITTRDAGPGFIQPVTGTGRVLTARKVADGAQKIYELSPAGPRAWMTGQVRPGLGRQPSQILADTTWDPLTQVVLDTPLTLHPGPQEGSRATVTRADLNELSLAVDAVNPGVLVVSDLYYPDWKVRVDGTSTPLLKADGYIRGVEVPAGHHVVDMKFESPAVARGLRISIAAAAVILALLLLPFLGVAFRRPASAAE